MASPDRISVEIRGSNWRYLEIRSLEIPGNPWRFVKIMEIQGNSWEGETVMNENNSHPDHEKL